jgi:hypothetical protein
MAGHFHLSMVSYYCFMGRWQHFTHFTTCKDSSSKRSKYLTLAISRWIFTYQTNCRLRDWHHSMRWLWANMSVEIQPLLSRNFQYLLTPLTVLDFCSFFLSVIFQSHTFQSWWSLWNGTNYLPRLCFRIQSVNSVSTTGIHKCNLLGMDAGSPRVSVHHSMCKMKNA